MVTVYYLSYGAKQNAIRTDLQLALSDIVKAFPNGNFLYSNCLPCVSNGDMPSSIKETSKVVLHVENGEVAGKINKDGYWMLQTTSPDEFNFRFRLFAG